MKFGGFDSNNNFIITCTHAEMIFKNFLIFYQNYSNPNINKENNNNEFSKENIKKKTNDKSFNFKFSCSIL